MAKKYLDVAYKDRDLAKRLGARWDPSVKRWYCTSGSDLARIFGWRKPAVTTRVDPHLHLTKPQPRAMAAQNFELPLMS